jgi:hypothetical protein
VAQSWPAPRLGRSVRTRFAVTVVVLALLAVNLIEHLLHTGWWLGPVVAVVLAVFARWSGLTWSQLGLGRDRLGSGLRWGVFAVGIVAAAYLAGVLLPTTRSAFLDRAITSACPARWFRRSW